MFLGYSKESKGYLFYNHKDNKVFVSTNAKFLEKDFVNNFNPRSKVVLAEIDELVIQQPMDETRDNVAILDTPQDSTHEMSSSQVPHRSGRIIRSPIRFIGLGETYKTILEDCVYVNLIRVVVQEEFNKNCFFDPLETLLNNFVGSYDLEFDIHVSEKFSLLDSSQVLEEQQMMAVNEGWKPCFEELPANEKKLVHSSEKAL